MRLKLVGPLAVVAGCGLIVAFLTARSPAKDVPAAPSPAAKAPYVHTVIFSLKKDVTDEQKAAMVADTHRLLDGIPSVKGLWVGKPAAQSSPDPTGKEGFSLTVAKDYSVGLTVLFEDADGLKTYLGHPDHLKYVGKYKQFWEKVTVYDFQNEKGA